MLTPLFELKLFESLLLNNLQIFIEKHNIFLINQYGFRKNYSTETQLRDLLYFITNCFNDKNLKCFDIIFSDKSDTFGSILLGKLTDELRGVGIFGTFLSLISNSLENRK